MKLRDSFRIPADRERSWALLQDIPAVASCLPGAQLGAVDGDTCTGKVKVKIGPIVIVYDGELEFVKRDRTGGVIEVRAEGKDKRGAGTVAATMRLTMEPASPGETACAIEVDVDITGKPAQFGRSAIEDVSSRLVRQFAGNLAALVGADDQAEPDDAAPRVRTAETTEAFDLLGGSRISRPIVGGIAATVAVALVVVAVLLRRRGGATRR